MGSNKQHSQSTEIGKSDLKKMFSAHVQENLLLQRQRSDLELAKVKKLRELNHNETIFMRKYEKYAQHSRPRHGSIDADILRVAEVNANVSRPGSRLEDGTVSQKSLGRFTINSECPYSYDTWNTMVDTEKNFVEESRNSILFSDISESREETDTIYKSPRVNPLLGRGKVTNSILSRRNTLEPLDDQSTVYEEDTIDEEIVSIQRSKYIMPRRHSLFINPTSTLPKIQNRRRSIDSNMVLPKLRTSFISSSNTRSLSDSDMDPDLQTPEIEKNGEKGHARNKNIRRKSVISLHPETSMHVSGANANASDKVKPNADKTIHAEERGILKNSEPQVKKLTANAAVFVRDECGISERMDKNESKDKVWDTEVSDANNNAKNEIIFPAISTRSSLTYSPDNKNAKSVTFDIQPRSRSGSIDSSIADIVVQKPVSKPRRSSMTSTSLKLLVDSHHGAAKLRYISLLATEMQKEAGIDSRSSPEDDKTFEQLKNCRYLRTAPNNGEDTYN